MTPPKPFQRATVQAALKAFAATDGLRRFLVADEVGLGKTVVAREIVDAISRDRYRQTVVYYVANGQVVAAQNKQRIIEFLPEDEQKRAVRTPDRLSLIAVTQAPTTRVAVYALTPQTSFPGVRAQLGGGRMTERAFIAVLLSKAFPSVLAKLPADFLRLGARSGWPTALREANERLGQAPPGLIARYREALKREFLAPAASPALPLRDHLLCVAQNTPRPFVGRLRRALALASLIHQPPDIVILDEFQRYRGLLDAGGLQDPLMRQLLAGRERGPALLLLSATPYKLYASRWEESRGALAHRELFQLIEFLAGESDRKAAEGLFGDFGDALREIVALAQGDVSEFQKEVKKAAGLRDRLQALIGPVIARTERDAFAPTLNILDPDVTPLEAAMLPEDVMAYRHLVQSFEPRHRPDALAYWSSIPLPAQALGQRYVVSRGKRFSAMRGLASLTHRVRNQFAPRRWPDAKLRALSDAAPADQLALPWVAPSLPWWKVGGRWAAQTADPKVLMFSRFKATPPAVAGLLSFGVESRWIDKRGGYDVAYGRRRLKLSDTPNPVMVAFHPCPWLITHTDPLRSRARTPGAVRRHIRGQLLAGLKSLKIDVDDSTLRKRRRHRPVGRLIPALEQTAGLAARSAAAWSGVTGNDRNAIASIAAWRTAPRLATVSWREVEDLTAYALCAPGVIAGRALLRHAPDALGDASFPELVRLSWQGLRAYLDNPVLLGAMKGESPIDSILKATLDGGLESVLDEHFWMQSQNINGAWALAADLRHALTLVTGGFSFQALGKHDRIRLRCHVAVPFGDAEFMPAAKRDKVRTDTVEGDALPARPDEVRKSFNTPFWPHVLTTTSVGQEGLDFHPWCSRVVHWDLPPNPLDLEQREGRIQRYAGLAVRRRLAKTLGDELLAVPTPDGQSPWRKLAAEAETRLADDSGLRPWWILVGARITRHIFERPFGRDIGRFKALREQRFIYRLALGQPNQEDLIDVLARGGPQLLETFRNLALDLSAFGIKGRK